VQGNYAREDAELMLAVLSQREKMYAEALFLYQGMASSYPRNYLLQYEVATLEGMLKDWKSAVHSYDVMLARHRAGEVGYENIPLTKVLYQSGQAHEHLQENEAALAQYAESAAQPGNDHYIYLSELAAANLEMHGQRPEAARPHYQRVAEALPDSEEGKIARNALKKLDKE